MQLQYKIPILLTLIGAIKPISAWTEVECIAVESIMNSSKVINMDIQAGKYNLTTYAINANVSLFIEPEDVDSYMGGVRLYSSKGNNQFKLFPIQIPRKSLRQVINGPYRNYVMNDLKPPVSNIPYTSKKNEDLAALILRPGNYTVNNYVVSKKSIPKTISNGLYKVVLEITQNGNMVAGYYALLSVY